MNAWINVLMAVATVAVLGIAATFYFRKIRLPREETAAGIAALAAMRWRDFVHLVLQAMGKRGYERISDHETVGDESDLVLERDGQRWLLSTNKHGTAYVLGSETIIEFANAIRLSSATGGVLVTPGQFAPEAKPQAAAQQIELLDGPTLWPEVRSLLPAQQRAAIVAGVNERARQSVLISWGGALVAGLLILVFTFGEGAEQTPAEQAIIAAPTSNDTAVVAATTPETGQANADAPAEPATPAGATLEQRRAEVAVAISTLPVVDRALWSTQSTLLVHLLDDREDPMPSICPLLQRHQELRATRVQLQPPAGSERPVRFVQCQVY